MRRLRSLFPGWFRRALWLLGFRFPRITRLVASHRILRVVDTPLAFAETSQLIFSAASVVASRNLELGMKQQREGGHSQFRDIHIHRFRDAQVVDNSRFNSVIMDNVLILPERNEVGPWSIYKGKRPRRVGLVHGQSEDLIAMKGVRPTRHFEDALYVGTRAPYNWYHWIANVLPALDVANQGNLPARIPLLLPEEVQRVSQMLEALEIFLAGREVVWLGLDELVHVSNLYWADSPVDDAPFAVAAAERRPLRLHPIAMEQFRARVLDWAGSHLDAGSNPSRIFLARRAHSARPYNSDEVEGWALDEGFEPVYLEELSFAEQVALFCEVTHVVGPTGAAFSNILFAGPSLRALRLHGGAHDYENYFANLAAVGGAQIFDLRSVPSSGEGYVVDEKNFRAAVRGILEVPPNALCG